MSSDKTTSRFLAFVSCGFAGAVVIGLGVWQLGVAQSDSHTTSDSGIIPAMTSDSPVPAAISGNNPSNNPPAPTPNGNDRDTHNNDEEESQPPGNSNDIKRDPLLPPRAYVAPDRGNQPKNTPGNVNTFVPPIIAENVPRGHNSTPPPYEDGSSTTPFDTKHLTTATTTTSPAHVPLSEDSQESGPDPLPTPTATPAMQAPQSIPTKRDNQALPAPNTPSNYTTQNQPQTTPNSNTLTHQDQIPTNLQ
ncbi:MAG: hypothetical protein Q4A82_00255 [Corynebacterium sp.]|nr:hypothetical protein [Corynebacterium sp.]